MVLTPREKSFAKLIFFVCAAVGFSGLAYQLTIWLGLSSALLLLPLKSLYDMGILSAEMLASPVGAISYLGIQLIMHATGVSMVLDLLLLAPLSIWLLDNYTPFQSPFEGTWPGPFNLLQSTWTLVFSTTTREVDEDIDPASLRISPLTSPQLGARLSEHDTSALTPCFVSERTPKSHDEEIQVKTNKAETASSKKTPK